MGRSILPRLKRSTWKGVDRSVCRPLLSHRSEHIPWVALGYEERPDFEFLPTSVLREGGSRAQDLEREAIRNVRVRELEWEASTISLGILKKLTMLSCQGDTLASEKILDVGFLRQAHAQLRADELLAGVPYRGMLTVADANGGAERLGTFGRLVVREYAEAGKDYVSPALFKIAGGAIAGVVDSFAIKELPQFAGIIKEDVDPGEPTVSVAFVRPRGEDLDEILVEAGGSDAPRLVEAVVDAVSTILMENPKRREFGGNVHVMLLTNKTPATTRARMRGLEENLRRLDADLLPPGRSLKLLVDVDGVPW